MAAAGDEEEKLKRDRDRLWRDFDPYSSGFTVHRTNARRQEAYDKCAPSVVQLMKCVDSEGPAWFWRCNAYHIELQKCYNSNKPESPSLITEYMRDFKDTLNTRWEQASWLLSAIFGGRDPPKS